MIWVAALVFWLCCVVVGVILGDFIDGWLAEEEK